MDERRETNRLEVVEDKAPVSHTSQWLAVAVVALIIGLGVAVGYSHQQQAATSQLVAHESDMNSTIGQLQTQVDSLTTKLNQVATAPPAVNTTQPVTDSGAAKRRTAAVNKHIKQLESQLDDQQKQLKDTQDQVAQARTDLEGNLSSTRDQLNGSIARTHDELVALEQKGERNYFEFDLTKAKHFQREGPIMLSLRKADAKHKHYDLALIVDDNQLSKKNVNLYEPVWINGSDRQQVQLVVNKVDKDHVHGYVSAPKYSQSASLTNISTRTSDASSTPAADQAGTTNDSTPTTPQQPQ